jgi:hypothetical protein
VCKREGEEEEVECTAIKCEGRTTSSESGNERKE